MISKVLLAALSGFVFSSVSLANATFVNFDLSKMEGSNQETTKAVIEQVKRAVIDECQAISPEDNVTLVSERVTNRDIQQHESIQPTACDPTKEAQCVTKAVVTADVFRYSNLVLRRTDSANKASYEIVVKTSWAYDEPVPMANAEIKASAYCKDRGLSDDFFPVYN